MTNPTKGLFLFCLFYFVKRKQSQSFKKASFHATKNIPQILGAPPG